MAQASARPGLPGPFQTLFRIGVVGHLSDEQLLRRFLVERGGADQVAFSMLVERHGPMVLRVCQQVLGDAHDAEDAFQATFLVLARRAAAIRRADSLASWLHGVAHRISSRARSESARRRIHEQRAGARKVAAPECDASRADSWVDLHEEVALLPRRYREPVVLCYLEGLSTEEVARRIGCPVGTIFSRLSRARERLRRRLVRRGLTPPAVWPAAGLGPPATVWLPGSLLNATVRSSQGFALGRLAEGSSASAVALARGLLNALMISKLKLLGAAGLVCALALGGAGTSGWLGRLAGAQGPVASAANDDPRAALTRSVDKLESGLEEASRRNAEMRQELREIRARLRTIGEARERVASLSRVALAQLARALEPNPARAVAEFGDALKRHPARRRGAGENRLQLYMLDLVEGGTTLVADEPDPGLDYCNTPSWSHGGTRTVFQARSWTGRGACRIKAIDVRAGRPTLTDLGKGHCPTFSRDDTRIAFALNPGEEPGAEGGVWVMQADGSGRSRVGEFGFPAWSPDGREFLLNQDTKPAESIVINLETREGGRLEVAGNRIFSWPTWAGPGTLVSCIGTGREGDAIVLLDARRPSEAKLIEVLWKRGEDLDVDPLWPVYSPATRRCVFVGSGPTGRALYTVRRGESLRARRLGPEGDNGRVSGLALSPDGRYLLFCANRPAPPETPAVSK